MRRTAGHSRVEHRVRLQGMIVRRPDGTASVTDSTGSLLVRIQEMTSGLPDTEVDVSGFVERTGPDVVLDSAVFRPIEPRLQGRAERTPLAGQAAGTRPPIATIAEIRRLPPVEARRGFPVRFRAVVTYWMKPRIRLAAIKAAVDARDAGAIRREAHGLKGAAGNLSAISLFEMAEILEQLGLESRFDAAEAAWRRLSDEAAHVLDALRRNEAAA